MQHNQYRRGSQDDVNDPAAALFFSMPDDYQDAWKDLRDRVNQRSN